MQPITLRAWVRRSILPPATGRARGTRYSEEHVVRIRAVQALRGRGLGLAQAGTRVRSMTVEELAAFASHPPSVAAAPAPSPVGSPTPAAQTPEAPVAYEFRAVEWIKVMPGLTLMVDPNGGEILRRIAQEIVTRYGLRAGASSPA